MPLALVLGGCWTPGPGELEPTRFPWDQPQRLARAVPAGEYCMVSLEGGSTAGIGAGGGGVVQMGCQVAPNARPQAPAPR